MIQKKFLIINATWPDWEDQFRNNDKIKYINKKESNEEYDIKDYYVMCMKLEDYNNYRYLPNNIFNNNLDVIDTLNNKTLFYQYMMKNFLQHIPEVYYYNHGNDTYIANATNRPANTKMILKPNLGYNGGGIKIITSFIRLSCDEMQNTTVSKYIDHKEHYVGQFLVMNGEIISKIYFKANNDTNHIKIGEINHYVIIETLNIDDSVYAKIFKYLNYSGFAHSDFINVNNTLVMFEINPWIGSCLIRNTEYFTKFINNLSEYVSKFPEKYMNTKKINSTKKHIQDVKLLVINANYNLENALNKYNNKVKCVNAKDYENYNTNDYHILCMKTSDYKLYNHLPNNIFNNNLDTIDMLENKSLFYKYMMRKFIDHIPEIYYYNHDSIIYIKDSVPNEKMIFKPNTGYYGNGIKIIHDFDPNSDEMKNVSVSKYIDHTSHYLGHFVVKNGKILAKSYFKASNPLNYIKKSTMSNYTIHDFIICDDSIYDKIFKDLNYSGFVHTDFIIHNNRVIIFEINPFPSTTLVKEQYYFNIFLDKILESIDVTPSPVSKRVQLNYSNNQSTSYDKIRIDQNGHRYKICANCSKKHYL